MFIVNTDATIEKISLEKRSAVFLNSRHFHVELVDLAIHPLSLLKIKYIVQYVIDSRQT